MENNPIITVCITTPSHIRSLGENLRDSDIERARKLGIPAHRALWRSYRESLICKTIFINDHVAAIWGCVGSPLGQTGKPWMIMSPATDKYPMRVAFRYRKELRDMLTYFSKLEDWVDVSNHKALKLLHILGFKFGEIAPAGKDGTMFVKATIVS